MWRGGLWWNISVSILREYKGQEDATVIRQDLIWRLSPQEIANENGTEILFRYDCSLFSVSLAGVSLAHFVVWRECKRESVGLTLWCSWISCARCISWANVVMLDEWNRESAGSLCGVWWVKPWISWAHFVVFGEWNRESAESLCGVWWVKLWQNVRLQSGGLWMIKSAFSFNDYC